MSYPDQSSCGTQAKSYGDSLTSLPKPQMPTSVNAQADNALESASRTNTFAESLWSELRQAGGGESDGKSCRSGIDGKLADAAEYSNSTLSTLQEIRAYLLG